MPTAVGLPEVRGAAVKLGVHHLTFIAEELGARNPPPLRYLGALLRHPDPVVREGAIYGVSQCMSATGARQLLERVAEDDPSPLIRGIAAESLEP